MCQRFLLCTVPLAHNPHDRCPRDPLLCLRSAGICPRGRHPPSALVAGICLRGRYLVIPFPWPPWSRYAHHNMSYVTTATQLPWPSHVCTPYIVTNDGRHNPTHQLRPVVPELLATHHIFSPSSASRVTISVSRSVDFLPTRFITQGVCVIASPFSKLPLTVSSH